MTGKKSIFMGSKEYAPEYSTDDIDKIFADAMNEVAEEEKEKAGH